MASTIQVLLVFLLYCCLCLGQEAFGRARRAVPPPSAEDYGELPYCVSGGPVGEGGCRIHALVTLSDGYDINAVPPPQDGSGPLKVRFSVNLNNILKIDEPNQVISVETTLRLGWQDSRINVSLPWNVLPNGTAVQAPYLLFNRDPVRHIWFPDVYVDKAKDLRMPMYKIPPAYLRMFEGGDMLYSARVNYDVACPMNFENYPLDVQVCELLFESWGTNIESVEYSWREEDSKVNPKITLNQHEFTVEFQSNINSGFSTGVFPGVILRLRFKRKLSYHMLRTYLPSSLFVCLAWFSMFIPLEHVPGRVTMGMTALLTLASMFGSLSTITPPISYTTKLDVWMVGCIVFVFATLAEFTVVIFLKYYLADISGVRDVVNVGGFILQAWENSSAKSSASGDRTKDDAQNNEVSPSAPPQPKPHPPMLQSMPVPIPTASSRPRRQLTAQSVHSLGGGLGGAVGGKKRSLYDVTAGLMNRQRQRPWTVRPAKVDNQDDKTEEEKEKEEQEQEDERAEKIILAIEKFSVIVFLVSFLAFNVFYWIDIVNINDSL